MSAVEQDLDEYMAGPDPDYDQAPEPPQGADDIDQRLRRLARIRADIAEVDAHVAATVARAQMWAKSRLDGDDPDSQYGGLRGRERWEVEGLEMWHRAVLADDPSRKTISLPCGTLKSRVQQPEWVFDDEVFIAWAAEHAPELVRIPEPKPQVDKTAAKKALIPATSGDCAEAPAVTEGGEVVPGVTVTVRGPSFTVVTEEVAD